MGMSTNVTTWNATLFKKPWPSKNTVPRYAPHAQESSGTLDLPGTNALWSSTPDAQQSATAPAEQVATVETVVAQPNQETWAQSPSQCGPCLAASRTRERCLPRDQEPRAVTSLPLRAAWRSASSIVSQ